ncbi:MAG: FHA domain-containing protein [Betaproteobacteria bacterium]|nr:FHA domain-containing protein [Betaproteobacteria bacterium]
MPLSLKIFRRAADRKNLVGERVLDDERVTVGRGATCTLILEDPNRYLSRLQAEFERTARGYLLRVLSAASPVVVNGVSYSQGSEVTVHAGDTVAMVGYDLEIVSLSAAKAPLAADSLSARSATGPVQASVQSTGPGTGRAKWLAAIGTAAAAGAVVLALSWPAIKGLLPESAEQKKAEQTIARLEGEARSMLKLVDSDRREIKEATAASGSEIERVEGLVRSTRTSQDRMAFDAALGEARRMAKTSIGLEEKVRERVEGASGLPKAEGTLSAAATAAKGGDRTEAIRLLEATVASLAQMRSRIAEDRKTTQAELEKRREDLLSAESRAMAEAEARARAEAEAKAKAKARAEAEAAQALEAEQVAQSAHNAAAPCLGRLSGTWSHPLGGTLSFANNHVTRDVESRNYGASARQITVMNVSSCENETMTYKIVRLALIDTDNPGQAYDKTEANSPKLSVWAKVNTQRYAISDAGLRFGKYTYARR